MLLIGRSLPGPNGKPQPLRRRHLLDEGSFYFQPNLHDAGPKVILGQSFPSGHGLDEGERLLDLLCKQPATARFLARKLAVRFVGDHPDEHLVARLADSFIKSGGNLTEEYETLVESPELWAQAARRAKVKTPSNTSSAAFGPWVESWVSSGNTVTRINFAFALVTNRLPGMERRGTRTRSSRRGFADPARSR